MLVYIHLLKFGQMQNEEGNCIIQFPSSSCKLSNRLNIGTLSLQRYYKGNVLLQHYIRDGAH